VTGAGAWLLQSKVGRTVREFDAWLERLACKPLPGAVSAAAVASAMGAGLITKACRVTLG